MWLRMTPGSPSQLLCEIGLCGYSSQVVLVLDTGLQLD